MGLRHSPSFITPNISQVKDAGTLSALEQISKILQDSFKRIYDDLVTVSVANGDALPTATAEWVGRFYRLATAGEDTLHFCIINTGTGAYSWKSVTLT